MNNKNYALLEKQAKNIVMKRIKGHRKGLPEVPTHEHSFRVYEIIKKQDDMNNDAHLAALLHDIVEDGGVTYEELADAGFSQRTIDLVRLCSHLETDLGKAARWTLMIAKLIEARDREAWAIKMADLLDNLKESRGLAVENRRFMVEVKAQLVLRLVARSFADHPLWSELMEETDIQRRDLYEKSSSGDEEKEVSKAEFKRAYFKYGKGERGWTLDYWQQFYENETGAKYFVREPSRPEEDSMMISSDPREKIHRLSVWTEDDVEAFFEPH